MYTFCPWEYRSIVPKDTELVPWRCAQDINLLVPTQENGCCVPFGYASGILGHIGLAVSSVCRFGGRVSGTSAEVR